MPQIDAPESTDSASDLELPFRDRRRTWMLASACTLLAIGIGLNVDRHYTMSAEPETSRLDEDSMSHEVRYSGYMMQPDGWDQNAGGQGQRHKGEEGKMGRPTSRQKSGLYAMKGPHGAVPQMARNFDPDMAARQAGVLGVMQQQSGHFLSSPYGGAFAVGNDDEDVWAGLTAAAEAGAEARAKQMAEAEPEPEPPAEPEPVWSAQDYRDWVDQVFVVTDEDATSTFSVDVDTGSYSLMRQAVEGGYLPSPDQVRVEEMINYFDYAYPEPTGEVPVSITTEVGPCPWDPEHRLVHVGLQGKHVAPEASPPRNLVFLIDVSGSMSSDLPLVVSSLTYLTEQLDERDRISIVVYAGAAGTVLEPTRGSDKATILDALDRLQAGGGTNGGEGIHQAYALAQRHFVEGGINRVVLATDGDFNVGVTGEHALVELIEEKRRSGVFLSVLGFGGANFQDRTMEQLADHGNGNYAYIDGLSEARKVLVEQAGATLVTIAKDVKIQVQLDPDAVHSYRLVGYDNRVLADRDFADDTKDAGDMGAGHNVTAMYEVVPRPGVADGAHLLDLSLRFKHPDEDDSRLVAVPVHDAGHELSETSDDFRFSAAVVGFGHRLMALPTKTPPGSLQALRDLALEARGDDRQCRRAEFVHLVEKTSALAGHAIIPATIECQVRPPAPVAYAEPLEAVDAADAADDAVPFDWAGFVLEVLYLLPPLLALPLFVMALRRPRRRRFD